MESPPTCSALSEVFLSSDDSGLLLTSGLSGSVSSSSGDTGACHFAMELSESDVEEKSLSHDDSADYSDDMCGDNFNTLKKGPGWPDSPVLSSSDSKHLVAIDPPPEFQDSPPSPHHYSDPASLTLECKPEGLLPLANNDISCCPMLLWVEKFASKFVSALLEEALSISCKVAWSIHCSQECHRTELPPGRWGGPRLCWTPELLSFSPCHEGGSRTSSRLSSSHNSLSVPVANRADDSSFITSAMSHDALHISDMYNVPFDSDIYAVPIDVVRPSSQTPQRPRRQQRHHRKRKRHGSSVSQSYRQVVSSSHAHVLKPLHFPPELVNESGAKRHSVPGTSALCQPSPTHTEPIHMTLHEVRQYLHNLYSSSSDSSENKGNIKHQMCLAIKPGKNGKSQGESADMETKSVVKNFNGSILTKNNIRKNKKTFVINIKNKKAKEVCNLPSKENLKVDGSLEEKEKVKKSLTKHTFSLKQTLCNIFRIRKLPSPDLSMTRKGEVPVVQVSEDVTVRITSDVTEEDSPDSTSILGNEMAKPPFLRRALPPLPNRTDTNPTPLSSPEDVPLGPDEDQDLVEEPSMDFASSIEKVKDYGWYWGPISGEAAEKILSNEPDGSFIVRDSSDDHYIFSLTFKLNGCIRHVRIEHDQGNFSFGSCTKFKSHTIVDFIQNAVEHSRSGRYLFFLHRRPVLGPMRVQLLHPVSRFKQVQSLQHMCRFVILKLVRRDLIHTLPLPRRLIDYMNTPHYYSEQLLEEDRGSSKGPSPSTDDVELLSFVPQEHS
uniref:Suppressor of cytokine signaling 7 n=1 Tax=Timema bartmani TaxID=61472 RepID=A0A7R9EZ46_9NEOP|nr:unnamed protein product [Timema bartmani]